MFKYIDTPKLVGFYLRDFCYQKQTDVQPVWGRATFLYRFVLCLCLPFVSQTFRIARLKALAIAECTDSQDQIIRVLKVISGADMAVTRLGQDFMTSYDGTDDTPVFPYDNSLNQDNPIVPYGAAPNSAIITVTLNGANKDEVASYLQLLIPFYIKTTIIYV